MTVTLVPSGMLNGAATARVVTPRTVSAVGAGAERLIGFKAWSRCVGGRGAVCAQKRISGYCRDSIMPRTFCRREAAGVPPSREA